MQMADKGEKLLPCPFCGGEAEYEQNPFDADKDTPVVQTVGCNNEDCIGYMPSKFFATKRDARAAWNRRPSTGAGESDWVEPANG